MEKINLAIFTKRFNIYLTLGGILFLLWFSIIPFTDLDEGFINPFIERESYLDLIILLLLGIIIIPVIEELSFRFYIGSKKIWIQMVSILFAVLIILILFFNDHRNLILIPLMFMVVFIRKFKIFNENNAIHFQVVLSSILFSLAHFGKIPVAYGWFIVMLYMMSMLGKAFIYCWLRIKYNIWMPIMLHIINNLIAFIAQANFHHNEIQFLTVNDMEITVKESPFYKNKFSGSSTVINDTLIIENMDFMYPLKINRQDEIEVLNSYIQKNTFLNYDIKIPNYMNIDIKLFMELAEEKGYVIRKVENPHNDNL